MFPRFPLIYATHLFNKKLSIHNNCRIFIVLCVRNYKTRVSANEYSELGTNLWKKRKTTGRKEGRQEDAQVTIAFS
jgi:hypothetical protein